MSPIEELLTFVRKVGLMRRAQFKYQTRDAGVTLAEVRKREAEVDELVGHLLAAPIPVDALPPFPRPADVEILPLPDSMLPPLPPNVVAMPFEQPAPEVDLTSIPDPMPEQPAEQPAPTGRRRGNRRDQQ